MVSYVLGEVLRILMFRNAKTVEEKRTQQSVMSQSYPSCKCGRSLMIAPNASLLEPSA